MSIKYHLYSTVGCHLCEEAIMMIQQLHQEYYVHIREIADSDELRERYGIRIPVLRHIETGAELEWPFTIEMVTKFMAL